jgi:hypothetical protein
MMSRKVGYRYAEALRLTDLANDYGDLGAWSQAAEYSRQAIEVADAISNTQTQSEARLSLARIQLLTAELQAAQHAALAARDHPHLPYMAQVSLVLGITQLRQGQPAAAAQEFGDAITQANQLLQQTSGAFAAQDTRALALCGLALIIDPGKAADAAAAFRAARTITNADGIVKQALALFDALAVADRDGILTRIRPVAEGKG